jgi:hypothetical protein
MMTIKRRRLISLITGFTLASGQTAIYSSLALTNYLTPTRKQNSPFFLGWYDYIPNANLAAKVANRGIDLLMPYTENSTKAQIKVFLDKAKAAKVKVLLEIYRPLIESGNIAEIKDFIRTYKNHPAVSGWYLYDEPEIKTPQPISPVLLTKIYQAIKAEDRVKPVALVFTDINKIAAYSHAMDILMWDDYPCKDGVAEFQWAPSYRAAVSRVAKLASAKNKKFLNVIQAYSGHGVNKRLPTKQEFRYMFYTSIVAGTDGLLFWMHAWATPAWNESVLYPTIKEFRSYLPAIVTSPNPKNIAPANSADLEIKLFPIPHTKKHLILAINHTLNQINSTVRLDRQLAGQSIALNKKIIAHLSAQSSFKVNLTPCEVRLYEIG